MKAILRLVNFDGFDINTETGEIKIKNILLRFDPRAANLEIDLLDALDLAVKALRDGTVKPTYIH
jgi:hypothetical protein